MTEPTLAVKQYAVCLTGYSAAIFPGTSKAQARYAAYKQFNDAVTRLRFVDFLARIDSVYEVKP